MVSIRRSNRLRFLGLGVVAALVTLTAAPAQAQQYFGTRNSKIGTIGDLAYSKLNPNIRRLPGLNFSTMGLFGDAEIFRLPEPFRPFIFALPNLSAAGLDFNGVTFDEYLNIVANSYGLNDSEEYLNRFRFQNPRSIVGDLLFPESNSLLFEFNQRFDQKVADLEAQFGKLEDLPPDLSGPVLTSLQFFRSDLIQDVESRAVDILHIEDFRAGGGFFPLIGEPTTPKEGTGTGNEFTPLILKTTTDGTTTDTSDTGELAALIADATGLTVDDNTGLVIPDSASQSEPDPAANVSVVPEPATLGLLVMGSAAWLGRSRRR